MGGRARGSVVSQGIGGHTPIGEMDDAGLLQILSAFLALIVACEGRFSPHLRKRVSRMVADLKAKMAHKP